MERNLALVLLCCIYYLLILSSGIVNRNSVPNVWEVIFPNISIQGGIVHLNVHGLFDGPSQAVLPAFLANNINARNEIIL